MKPALLADNFSEPEMSLELLRRVASNANTLRPLIRAGPPIARTISVRSLPPQPIVKTSTPTSLKTSPPRPLTIPRIRPRVRPRHETGSRSASLNARIEEPLSRIYPGKLEQILDQARELLFITHAAGSKPVLKPMSCSRTGTSMKLNQVITSQ